MTKGQKITLGVFALYVGWMCWVASPTGDGLKHDPKVQPSIVIKAVNAGQLLFGTRGGVALLIITFVVFRAFRKPKADDEMSAGEVQRTGTRLTIEANRLAQKGQIKEALAAHDDIASRFGDTDFGKDAKISADELRKRVGEQLPVGKGGGEDKDASKPDKKEDRFKDTRKYDKKGDKL